MNLKGGYIILSLLALALVPTEEATAITNEEVLKQLLSLSDYALHPEKELKPIYLRAKDSNGVEVVSLCELNRNNGVLRIKAFVMDSVLTIYVAYDIDEETQEVLIDSAIYEYISEPNEIINVVNKGLEDEDIEVEKLKYLLDENIVITNLPAGINCYYAHARISNEKLSIVIALNCIEGVSIGSASDVTIGSLSLSEDILNKLYPYVSMVLANQYGYFTSPSWQSTGLTKINIKKSTGLIYFGISQVADSNVSGSGDIRFEFNFLLS